MRRSLLVVATLVLTAGFWAVPAAAQGNSAEPPYSVIDFQAPFQFVAVNTTLPAGRYLIERTDSNDPTIWTLTDPKGDIHVEFFAKDAPTRNAPGPGAATQTKVIFDELDGHNFLSQFWVAGTDSGRQVEEGHAQERIMGDHTMKPVERIVKATSRHEAVKKSRKW